MTRPPRLVLLSLGITAALGIAGSLLTITQGSGPRHESTADAADSEITTQGSGAQHESTADAADSDALTREQAAALISRMTGQYGNWVPNTKYYDPELALSAVIGETAGGTATSPKQLFFFHRGVYLRPATPESRFAFRIVSKSDDLIVVHYSHYRQGDRSCCPSLSDYVVRYKWTSRGVKALDPIPPESQGWWP